MKSYYTTTLLFLLLAFQAWSQQQSIGLFQNDSLSFNGYTMWTAPNYTTYLIDNCGYQVHSWPGDAPAGLSSYLAEDGHLWRTSQINGPFDGAGAGGRIDKYTWEGELVWSFNATNSEYQQHHDIEPMPNGNVLVIAWELRTVDEAEAAGAADPTVYWPLRIIELEPVGNSEANIVWEWHLWDHLVQDQDSTKANFGVVAAHPELLDINYAPPGNGPGPFNNGDWVHSNSIDYHAERDEILISARGIDEIFIIDHSTTTEEAAGHTGGNSGKGGDLLYRWGNPQAYQSGTSADAQLFGQHDAKWMPDSFPYGGQIMIFNNGVGRPEGNYSTVVIIDPPLDENGQYLLEEAQAFGPEELSWEFVADPPTSMFTNSMGGVQALPNGNALICISNDGTFWEVTSTGELVWEYINPVGFNGPVAQGQGVPGMSSTFRATRYAPDYPAFEGRDLTPGNPVELDPFPSDCIIYDGTISSTSASILSNSIRLLQNPITGIGTIVNPTGVSLQIEVYTLSGQILWRDFSNWENIVFDATEWATGMYILRFGAADSGVFQVQKFIKTP